MKVKQDTKVVIRLFQAAVGLLVFTAVLNEVVLSFVHERVPATAPLPDILFSAVPYWQKGLEVCE